MSLTDTMFGSPGQTQIHQTPATKPPGFNFAKNFFGQLPGLTNNPYPTYQGQLDPGLSPTMQDAIRRAQGYAQSSPAEILQGVQGMVGGMMSPNFANPWNSLFGGAANYGGVNGQTRGYGGQPMENMTFQSGMSQPPIQGQNGTNGGMGGGQQINGGQWNPQQQGQPQMAMRGMNASTGQSGGFIGGQWQPNGQPQPMSMDVSGMQQLSAMGMGGAQRNSMMPQMGAQAGGMGTAPPGMRPGMPGQGGSAGPYGGIMGGQGMDRNAQVPQRPPQPSMPMNVSGGAPGGFQDALNMNFNDAQGALSRMFQGNTGGLNEALAGQYGMNQYGQQNDGRGQFMHSTDHQSALRELYGREPTFNEVQESLRSGSGNIEAARTSFMSKAPADASAGWSGAQKDLSSLIDQYGMAKGSQMFNQQAGDGPMWAGGSQPAPGQPPISMPSIPMGGGSPTPQLPFGGGGPPSGGIIAPPQRPTIPGGKIGQSPTDQGVMKPIPDQGGSGRMAQGREVIKQGGVDGVMGKGGRFQPLGKAALDRGGSGTSGGIRKPDLGGVGAPPRRKPGPTDKGVMKPLPKKDAPRTVPPATTAQTDMLKAYL